MAEITVQGWLAKDAEVRYTSGGTPVTTLSIPENHQRKNDQGRYEDTGETTWREVTIWRDADFYGQLRKGEEVLVIGTEKLEVSENNGRQYHRLKITPRVVARVMRAPKNQQGNGGGFGGNQGGGYNQQGNGYQQPPANAGWDGADEEPPF